MTEQNKLSPETQAVQDLARHATNEAMSAAMRVARLGDMRDGGAILHVVGTTILIRAAQTFAAQQTLSLERAADTQDPLVVQNVRAIAAALGLYPDAAAMDLALAEAMGAVLMS